MSYKNRKNEYDRLVAEGRAVPEVLMLEFDYENSTKRKAEKEAEEKVSAPKEDPKPKEKPKEKKK